ncbi:MAG TPA: hypothetical protein VGQ41_08820 [Pyrinomonadaceae bacterium]|jgi:hypothetical protein|nr:hypothetical protein [Pyrinomonadaceae bacterium]
MMNISPRTKLRLLGIFPLIFFFAQVVHYWPINELGNMFWMCNLGNLLLALGLFLEKPVVIRLAAIWMIPGLVIWIIWVVLAWGVFLSSTLAHVGGLAVALIALSQVGMDRTSWRWAFGWYLVVQLLSRFLTAPALNVNLAHAVQPGWDRTFHAYWMFWLVLTAVTILTLWLSGLLLWSIWPAGMRDTLLARSSD